MALTNQHRVRIFSFCCIAVLLSAVFIGGHHPSSGRLFPPPWDKVVHFSFYGTLTFFVGIALPKIRLPIIWLIIISIGIADEIHQIFVPGRHAEFSDLGADAIGALTALAILPILRRKLKV